MFSTHVQGWTDLSNIKPADIPERIRAAFWSKPLEAPSWLVKAKPDALVHAVVLHLFDDVRTADGKDLAAVIEGLTGESTLLASFKRGI